MPEVTHRNSEKTGTKVTLCYSDGNGADCLECGMSDVQIPGLELTEKLGEGGMASVWKARQLSLDRIVAVKILPAASSDDTEDVRRFHAEAKSAAKLKHPGIVQVYDVKLDQGLHYIVMEYIAGYTVRDWLKRKGKLTEREALEVVDCVADALGYAWDKERIVHCDIKSDNIMVDSDGTVKVADLGLARSSRSGAGGQTESHIIGTPAYMSPEQAIGVSDLDCRSDIYSLGAMLYELLTGKYLFEGHTAEETLELQVRDTVEDPAVLAIKLSKGTFWLLEKMLAKDRTKRYQSWTEVRNDIARVMKGKVFGPLLVDGDSTVRRGKHRGGQITAATGKVVTGKHERSPLPLVLIIIAMVILASVVVVLLGRNKPTPSAGPVAIIEPAANPAEEAAGRLFDAALAWARNNPAKYDESIAKFEVVAEKGRGTRYAARAESEITRLGNDRESLIQEILARLKEQTAQLADDKNYGAAASIYESYTGELSTETKTIRLSIAQQLRDDERSLTKMLPRVEPDGPPPGVTSLRPTIDIQTRVDRLLDVVAAKLLANGVEVARSEMAAGIISQDLASRSAELEPVRNLLDGVVALSHGIMESFREQKGQQIKVTLNSGQIDFVVSDVRDDKVIGIHKRPAGGSIASVGLSLGITDLAPSEKIKRMSGTGDSPSASLAKGLLASSSRAYPLARTYFAKTHPLLSRRLLARTPGR